MHSVNECSPSLDDLFKALTRNKAIWHKRFTLFPVKQSPVSAYFETDNVAGLLDSTATQASSRCSIHKLTVQFLNTVKMPHWHLVGAVFEDTV
jgi:hypothetical protein